MHDPAWSAIGRQADAARRFVLTELADAEASRLDSSWSPSDGELSPAALAARVLAPCVRELVGAGRWGGPTLATASLGSKNSRT
jgi:LysR family tcuABC transcriptional regulator